MALWSMHTNETISGQSSACFSGAKSVKYTESFFSSDDRKLAIETWVQSHCAQNPHVTVT